MSGGTIIAIIYSIEGFNIEGFNIEAYNSILVDSAKVFYGDNIVAFEVIVLKAYRNIITNKIALKV